MQQKKRYHVNMGFFNSPLMLEVVNVYQISDLACSYDYEVPDHRQICHEISCVTEGEGVFRRNGKEYSLSPGMLFLVRKEDIHYIRSSKTNPLRYLCLGFTFNRNHPSFEQYEKPASFFDQLAQPVAKDLYNVHELLSAAISELTYAGELSTGMLFTYVLQAIITTYRSFQKEPPRRHTDLICYDRTNPLIYEMIRYIDENVTTEKGLGEMGRHLGYSYSYLSHLFSSTMGTTLRQYYAQRRFEKAAQLLKEGYSLARLAEKMGFADTASFCKAFKKHYKTSPGEYRRRNF